jgi:spermidine synthase
MNKQLSYSTGAWSPLLAALCFLGSNLIATADVVYEVTSPYHHIRVLEQDGMRTLCFDDATESRMSIEQPLTGHFEYTEYFHMPFLWNAKISNVLMVGLGGASAQRSFEHYYPDLSVETVEIDPNVLRVAKNYFNLVENDRQKVHVEDGRVYLRRTTSKYNLIIMDAYLAGRYGSGIPQHLATKEFFEIVRDHLTTNGIVAYNVIGTISDWHADIVGAIYRTLKTIFPQVYMFPATSSRNVVLVATLSPTSVGIATLRQRAAYLVQTQKVTVPGFVQRIESFRAAPPMNAYQSPVLTDDFAPVEGLSAQGGVDLGTPSRTNAPPRTNSPAGGIPVKE